MVLKEKPTKYSLVGLDIIQVSVYTSHHHHYPDSWTPYCLAADAGPGETCGQQIWNAANKEKNRTRNSEVVRLKSEWHLRPTKWAEVLCL